MNFNEFQIWNSLKFIEIIFEINVRDYNYTGKILLSECEYYNGEKHGQQKDYYDNGNIQFEGQYEYGNSNGHGKKYEMNGRLRFDGEYFNGIAWNGIQYDYDNNTTIILDIEN